MPESLDKTIPPGCGTARRQKQAPRERFIRVGEVSAMIGLGKTTIYKYVSERRFPTPVALGLPFSLRQRDKSALPHAGGAGG